MAVDKVQQIDDVEGIVGLNGPISTTARYEVTFDAAATTIDACTADDGTTAIPTPGTTHPSYSYMKAQQARAVRTGKSTLFTVYVPYTTTDSTLIGSKAVAPLERTTKWFADGAAETIEVDTDAAGNLLKTSAGEVLKLQIPWANKVMIARKNAASMLKWDNYFYRMNNNAVTLNGLSYAAKTVLCLPIKQDFTEEVFEGENVEYYDEAFTFHIILPRPGQAIKTWNARLLDAGTLVLENGKLVPLVKNGSAVTAPMLLDGSGEELESGSPYFLNGGGTFAQNPDQGTAIFGQADFSALPVI